MSEKPLPPQDPGHWNAIGIVWEVIAMVTIPTTIFALAGRWLDGRFGTSPLFLVLGLLLTLGFVAVYVTRRGKDIAKKL